MPVVPAFPPLVLSYPDVFPFAHEAGFVQKDHQVLFLLCRGITWLLTFSISFAHMVLFIYQSGPSCSKHG